MSKLKIRRVSGYLYSFEVSPYTIISKGKGGPLWCEALQTSLRRSKKTLIVMEQMDITCHLIELTEETTLSLLKYSCQNAHSESN